MLTVEQALAQVLSHTTCGPPRTLPVSQAAGLVLAEDIASDVDSPPHDKSIVDGYALRASDVQRPGAELAVLEEITAGKVPSVTVREHTATRVMTGAPVPAGADAVVMVEQTQSLAGGELEGVKILADVVTAGQNISRRASSMTKGTRVLARGHVLRAIELGVLAEVGRSQVQVVPRPTVAVLATGNELVPADAVPPAGHIRNSNGLLLASAATAAGATSVDLGIARDEPDELREKIARGLESDVLVISGGVSAGVLDLVPGVLESLGVRQVFHKVSLKPGKPLWFGSRTAGPREHLVFGLPGNPVSSLVCFELFVRPSLARLAGREDGSLEELTARLVEPYQHRGDRPTYHPARLTRDGGQLRVQPLRWQGSGDLATLVAANALACFPAGSARYEAEQTIRVLRLN